MPGFVIEGLLRNFSKAIGLSQWVTADPKETKKRRWRQTYSGEHDVRNNAGAKVETMNCCQIVGQGRNGPLGVESLCENGFRR